MEDSELQSNQDIQKQSLVNPMSDKDESGFGEDISCCSLDDKSLSGKMDCSLEANESEIQVTPSVHTSSKISDSSQSDNDISLVGLKKDDSGIYSEKSPSLCLTKESSDGDLSESICESFDDTNGNLGRSVDGAAKFELNIDVDELNGVEEALKLDNGVNKKLVKKEKYADCDSMEAEDSEHLHNHKGNSDKIINEMMDLSESNGIDVQTESSKTKGENTEKSFCDDDNNDNDDEEKEDFGDFIRKTVKSQPHVKKLVDYDSESDDGSGEGSGVGAQGRRQYRKRKPDSDSDANDDDNENKSTEDVSSEFNSGSPILLRHSRINVNSIHNDVEVSDLSSDSSDESHLSTNAKHESSDSDDEPPVSDFGPPKHKWRALNDLRCREFGFSATKDPGYFRKRVQGSLQMVQRFQLQFKMNHHEGCVNALHFNRIGIFLYFVELTFVLIRFMTVNEQFINYVQ